MLRFQWHYKITIQRSSVQITALEKDNPWQNTERREAGKSKTVTITKLHSGYSFHL